MSITNKLLKLAAKVALDRLLGKERTDELVELLKEWSAARDLARKLAANPEAVGDAVWEVIQESGANVTREGRESMELAIASGIAELEDSPSERELWDVFLPGTSKTYVILSDDPRLTGGKTGRFMHFNWYKEGYRVRDWLGGRFLYPQSIRAGNEGLTPVPLDMTALDVWNASHVRIHSLGKYGLDFPITEKEHWQKVLALLTESARQISKK